MQLYESQYGFVRGLSESTGAPNYCDSEVILSTDPQVTCIQMNESECQINITMGQLQHLQNIRGHAARRSKTFIQTLENVTSDSGMIVHVRAECNALNGKVPALRPV
jgi:hypothetical protein